MAVAVAVTLYPIDQLNDDMLSPYHRISIKDNHRRGIRIFRDLQQSTVAAAPPSYAYEKGAVPFKLTIQK